MADSSVLIAGIGNIFAGDDGFGVEVARRLSAMPLPDGVRVVDFGVRGFDLACALLEGYATAILVDAARTGRPPGTVCVIEPDVEAWPEGPEVDGHGLVPGKVFALARALGGSLPPIRLVACEPERLAAEDGDVAVGLSEVVEASVEPAMQLALALALAGQERRGDHA